MVGKIAEVFIRLALELRAELLDPYQAPDFRVAPSVNQDLGQFSSRPTFTGSMQMRADGLGVSTVCTRCGWRAEQAFEMLHLFGRHSAGELAGGCARRMEEHIRVCPGHVDTSFSPQLDQLVIADAVAISKLVREGDVVPPHLLIQYRDGIRQLAPMHYLQDSKSELEQEGITAGVHAVLRNEMRASARAIEAVVFVTDPVPMKKLPDGRMVPPDGLTPDAPLNICACAVDSLSGGVTILPLNPEAGHSGDLNWKPLTEVFGILDGLLAEEATPS